MVTIYTDGACAENPGGRGGWACIIVDVEGQRLQEFSGGSLSTTSNRMEMQAAIEGLLRVRDHPCVVVSDSRYLVDGASKWIKGWKRNRWITKKARTPVKNQDLWQQLDGLMTRRTVQWTWVRGHAGHHYNERCDELANREAGMASGQKRFTGVTAERRIYERERPCYSRLPWD